MPSIAFTEPDMLCQDSSDDSLRRLTDDFGRHRLTDLVEADESEEDGLEYFKSSARRNRYTSIASTASSMDGLWDLHPRRLSEAGLSRHSDSSAVLTEDTDSFIIGQRVWVGGTKPGTIAYIGETQFAPGEWAGIALDEAIGKNDGSVGGIRYFQCESKKGVFSRLTRLTRVPLEQPGMGSNETFTTNNGVRRSPISPTGSTKSLLKSPTLSNSNTSLASAAHIDFKIGDRVIIKSTQGSKIGTVRYMGLTDFAPGEWVGVELDDPRGKNDGSVEGKRYFECRPNFGLFAPISKVSKSPSKYKPSACVVHSGPGLPPSGLKRTNSKESMTSLASKTSAASSVRRVRLGVTSLSPKKVSPKTTTPLPTRTALQDVLREKQQHIEQLLRERDLERAEITRAASQADEAEQKFHHLKQEFEQYRSECETMVRHHGELLSRMKLDREEILSQLDDEKRKNEDLQFRFEEASITRNDIEANVVAQTAVNDNYLKKIAHLEANLKEERQKAEALESISNKLFEAEESLIKAREEVDHITHELSLTRNERAAVEEEKTVTAQLVESLQRQVEGAGLENEEKAKTISQLNEELANVKSEHEVVKRGIEDNCVQKDDEIAKLRAEIAHQKRIIEKYEKTHATLAEENQKLKMQYSAKCHDVETSGSDIVAKEDEIKSLHVKIEEANHKVEDLERKQSNSVKVEEDLRKELAQTRDDLKAKISEVENVKKECNVQLSQKSHELDDRNNTISRNSEEITKLTDQLNELKQSFEDTKKDIHSRHARQVASQDSQLMALSAELQQKNEEITKYSIVISKLEEDLCTKNGIIEKLRLEVESWRQQQATASETSSSMTKQSNELSLKCGDLERQLQAAHGHINNLQEIKQGLESEIQSLMVKCEGAAQLEQLRNALQAKEGMLAAMRTDLEQKLHNSERLNHELQLQHQSVLAESNKLKQELENKLQISMQSEQMGKQRYDSVVAELAKVREEHGGTINQLQRTVQEKDLALKNFESNYNENLKQYQAQWQASNENLKQSLETCQQRIGSLNDETMQLKSQLMKKSEELIEAQTAASHVAAQSKQAEREHQQACDENTRRLEFELNERSLHLQKALNELDLLRNDCHSSSVNLTDKDRQIGELSAQIQQSQTFITKLQEDLNMAHSLNAQKAQEHATMQSQCQGLIEKVATLTQQAQSGEEVSRNLQVEYNNAMHLMQRLRITEQQKQECLQRLEQEAARTAENKNCTSAMGILEKIQIETRDKETPEKIINLQKNVEVVTNQLTERNHQYEAQQAELLRLQEELLKAQEAHRHCSQGQEQSSILQDKELAENQIKFLNSIIVDIQRKNDEQKARIEILEAGCSPEMANELKLFGSPGNQGPPRMYCDICEEFDLHETEDCPKQNSDDAPAIGKRVPRSVTERPYCEICEAFGHATEDCTEDQTF